MVTIVCSFSMSIAKYFSKNYLWYFIGFLKLVIHLFHSFRNPVNKKRYCFCCKSLLMRIKVCLFSFLFFTFIQVMILCIYIQLCFRLNFSDTIQFPGTNFTLIFRNKLLSWPISYYFDKKIHVIRYFILRASLVGNDATMQIQLAYDKQILF